jgi:hypothetical protein
MRNADNDVIYVGCTARISERLNQHRQSKPWFSEVTQIDLEDFVGKDAAVTRERELINEHRPVYEWSPQSRALRPEEWRQQPGYAPPHNAGRTGATPNHTPNRVIRVPDQLWHAAQAKAAYLGVPLAAVIRDYLRRWITEDDDAT